MTEGDGWPSDANACQKHEAGRLLQLRAEAIAKKTDAYLWIKTVASLPACVCTRVSKRNMENEIR